jgi:hypothetical protein
MLLRHFSIPSLLASILLAPLVGCAAELPVAADTCPVPRGVEHRGLRRFMVGVNYPWQNFGADFGGVSKWEVAGVSRIPGTHVSLLADMKAHGADVVRWWVLPDFRSDAVVFDEAGNIVGLGGTAVADIQKALAIAGDTGVHLMFCLFSFDAFRPTSQTSGVRIESLAPIVRDPAARRALVDLVVRPLARAVQRSPQQDRLVAWDLINEPEWAMKGKNPYGDPAYTPTPGLDPVEHAQMEAFVAEVGAALKEETPGVKLTLGSVGVKWAHAWKNVGLDFYQVHWYDWLETRWPHVGTPESYGLGDKPVVVGEFPAAGMAGKTFYELASTWSAKGYAGALGWSYHTMDADDVASMKRFSEERPCETSYSPSTPR